MTILRENLRTSFVFFLISLTRTWSTSLLSTNHQMYELILLRFPRHALFWFLMMPLCRVWECTPLHCILWNVMQKSAMSCLNLLYATRNCLLHEFSSRPAHSDCCPCVSLLHVLLVLVLPRSTNCDSLMLGSKSSTSAILISVSQELHQAHSLNID